MTERHSPSSFLTLKDLSTRCYIETPHTYTPNLYSSVWSHTKSLVSTASFVQQILVLIDELHRAVGVHLAKKVGNHQNTKLSMAKQFVEISSHAGIIHFIFFKDKEYYLDSFVKENTI